MKRLFLLACLILMAVFCYAAPEPEATDWVTFTRTSPTTGTVRWSTTPSEFVGMYYFGIHPVDVLYFPEAGQPHPDWNGSGWPRGIPGASAELDTYIEAPGVYVGDCPGPLDPAKDYVAYIASVNGNWAYHAVSSSYHNPPEEQHLPVQLSSFTATQTSISQALIKWTVGSETSMLGYHVYAGTSNQLSSAECMSSNYIPAQNNSSTTSYSFVATDITEYGTYYFWLEAIPQGGNSDFYGPITLNFNEPTTPQFPDRTELFNAYPNPFYNSTTLRADLKAGEKGKVAIYNVSGQLVNTYSVTQGTNNLLWDGRDTRGNDCPNGIYFYKLDTPSQHQVKKLIIAK